jgi:hypothetical protein
MANPKKRINLGKLQSDLEEAARAVESTLAAKAEADQQYADALEEQSRAKSALFHAMAELAS